MVNTEEKIYITIGFILFIILILICICSENYAPLYFSPWYNTIDWIPRWRKWTRHGPFYVPYRERRWWKRRFLY